MMKRSPVLIVAFLIPAACMPLPLVQDARIVPSKVTRYGVGGGLLVSLDEETVYQPDGPSNKNETTELQYTPLPFVSGWGRVGLGGGGELQVAFQLPSFAISLGGKYGLVGREAGSAFALALSGDVTVSPVMVEWGIGGSLHATIRLSKDVDLDLTGRFGTWVGQWHVPAVTTTMGVTIHDGDKERWHVTLGWAQPVAIPGFEGRSIQAGFAGVAWSR